MPKARGSVYLPRRARRPRSAKRAHWESARIPARNRWTSWCCRGVPSIGRWKRSRPRNAHPSVDLFITIRSHMVPWTGPHTPRLPISPISFSTGPHCTTTTRPMHERRLHHAFEPPRGSIRGGQRVENARQGLCQARARPRCWHRIRQLGRGRIDVDNIARHRKSSPRAVASRLQCSSVNLRFGKNMWYGSWSADARTRLLLAGYFSVADTLLRGSGTRQPGTHAMIPSP